MFSDLESPNSNVDADLAQDIFNDPSFFSGGATASDVRQGMTSDCWFLSGLTAISNKQTHHLIDRICVARDEEVGVYGFVFHRGKFQLRHRMNII